MSGLPTDAKPTAQRLPALDGYRALAITIIVLFHFHLRNGHLVPGAFVGGDMFFAASAFLITRALVLDFERRPHGVTRRFYVRRAQRLLPAVVFFLAIWLVVAWLARNGGWFNVDPFGPRAPFAHLDFADAWPGALLVITFTFNWAKVARTPTAISLGHLWYLAAQEQFYAVWIPVLVACLHRSRALAMKIAIVGAVASYLLSLYLWNGGAGDEHVYFGTDARAQSLLIGAAAALAWRSGWFDRIPGALRAWLAAAGWVTLGLIAFHYNGDVIKYKGAFSIAALCSVAIITHILDGGGALIATVLGSRPLVWLGRRSYAIYIWHYPFACWLHRIPDSIGVPLGLTATLVAAELSWRLVESRFTKPETAKAEIPPAPRTQLPYF